ncbi:hypothetical protein PV458_05190 [Streptomyces sp. MN03-5084-2B]|nr:hypothetical protein [Streptomyces sp. MN03-5084-2B]
MHFPPPEIDVDERGFYVRTTPDFVAGSDVFALARTTFAWLVTGPDPVSVDGGEIAGLPARPIPLDELGTLLLAGDCSQATRDAAWAYLITRARAENGDAGRRGTWTMACVGLALPVLLRAAALVTRRFTGDTHDLNAAVLAGFLQGLHEVDLGRRAILARLYWAARLEGRRALREATARPVPVDDLEFDSAPPPRRQDHPDLVLADAVEAGAITVEEADLISETRVGEVPLAEAAHARGLNYKAAQRRRHRAEHRLVDYLNEHDGATPETPVDQRPGTDAGHQYQGPPAAAATTASSSRTRHLELRNVTKAAGESAADVGAPLSSHGPKSPTASCGTRVPADRRSHARRTACGPATPTRREARSCD